MSQQASRPAKPRDSQDVSRVDVVSLAGVDLLTVARWESGEDIPDRRAPRLAGLLGVTVSWRTCSELKPADHDDGES